MGMYTEFLFRAPIKKDSPLTEWLDALVNDPDSDMEPFDSHEFFQCPRWESVFYGGGAVYQFSEPPHFTTGEHSFERNWLRLHVSLKNYGDEIGAFIEFITPHIDLLPGDYLGYSLYEESRPVDYGYGYGQQPVTEDREQPYLHFMPSN